MDRINLFPALQISSSGLSAERARMEIASHNLANAQTTSGADGQVYRRKQVVFQEVLAGNAREQKLLGVEVSQIVDDPRPPRRVHAPYHPAADESGMIETPSISPIEEMLDMITASRAYQANLAAMRQSRDMARQTITLGKPQG